QQLEQKRRETLSLEQVSQLADELNLDPQLLQQALAQVSAEEARRAAMQVQTPVTAQKQKQLSRAWVVLVISLLLMVPLLLLLGYSTVRVPAPVAPPVAIQVQEAAPPVATPPLTPPAPSSPAR
ncbi:MAG: hypothetical protein ACO1SX_01560, partial [Actinomycetota bacterium]